jgi:hypothetical protein
MESVNFNGGIIGVTMDYGATDQYIVSTTQVRGTISYVGGRSQTSIVAAAITVSLTGLTGGLSTAPITGDIVLVVRTWATTADQTFTTSSTGWTKLSDLYAVSTSNTNFGIFYKIMGTTPDTSIVLNQNNTTAESSSIAVYVFRGVDTTTPFDVASTTVSQTSSGIPNPPAITPTTTNSIIVVAAGTSHTGGTDTFTAGYLTNFLTVGANSTIDSTVGIGWVAWTSGAYDPAAWTFSQTDSSTYTSISVTMALRAALVTVPVYGNKKNSGIWNLQAVYGTVYIPPGQQLFTTSQSFVVPGGVTQLSAVVVGGGGGGAGAAAQTRTEPNNGGGGGALGWATFNVTPGETLTITVGAGGTGGGAGGDGGNGGPSAIVRGTTDIIRATGGSGGVYRENPSTAAAGGTFTAGTVITSGGGNGGASGAAAAGSGGSGGGGAGGYSAAGGAGGTSSGGNGVASTGGGGGGGGGRSGISNNLGGAGGGVGVLGAGANGTAGTSSAGGGGGSSGSAGATNGATPSGGGLYGGGGGGRCDGQLSPVLSGSGGAGGAGAVRIIWGNARSYPSTRVGDL